MNKNELSQTEWIKTVNNEGKEIQFEVASDWLWTTLRELAVKDAEDVVNDKATYIKGRTDHLYDHLEDENFANSIYDLAVESKVIISTSMPTSKIIICNGNAHLLPLFWEWATCTEEEYTEELKSNGWVKSTSTKYLTRNQLDYLNE